MTSYLLFNSWGCRCSLTARLFLLLLLLSPLTGACNSHTPGQEEDELPPIQQFRQPDTLATKASSPSATGTTELLENPFIADRGQGNKLEAYFVRISDNFTLDADPIENRHKPDISDTIYTIRFGDSVMELYAPSNTGDLHLQEADIRNSGITLRNNMKVGMSQPELMNKLKQKGNQTRILQTTNEVVVTTQEGAPVTLRFFLKNGKVNRIRYEAYLD